MQHEADKHTNANMKNQEHITSDKHTSHNINPSETTIPSTNSTSPAISPSPHSKPCTICHTPRDVLIRCQIDETKKWHFVCTGKCWKNVSGGEVDGDGIHPEYRYGGMWKNKHEAVSAKIKGKAKDRDRKRDVGKSEENGIDGQEVDGV
ncbi:hypothetical protein SBOR_7677 [Sclerotinia borealis F-4128]|uniref:Uncharacterized protein n=1 Tax=Sclerotinia borealis (strain F-4128) TaxID=1432307 RepID=W9C5A7_SCLBF|nr:hypothetical protein SBOR_7677 [Sclerotinia borealis F-4128]